MIERMWPESAPPTFRFWDGIRETAFVLAAVVGFGLAWAEPVSWRDASTPPHYPGRTMSDRTADESTHVPSTWLVDGFNVLHAGILGGRDRHEWWTEPRRRELLDRVSLFDGPCSELWVVFDGPNNGSEEPPAEPGAGDPPVGPGSLEAATGADSRLRAVFAESADEWMLARVRAADDPAQIAVVTADRAVASRARHRGAQVVSPRTFLARCNAPSEPGRAL